jgi:DNA polymerase III subunit epsilon
MISKINQTQPAPNQEIYTVVDIETTGGNYRMEKITEIAIYKFDGENIIDEFQTLINPECNIPYFITNLTGITNEMVKNAPKFYEIAKRIVEFTEDSVFVAHNVNFDYSFIKQEFKNLGYDFTRKQLCTVRMSRKIIPGLPSYSLGNLCKRLGISIHARHRAAGDALATVQVLKLLLKTDQESKISKSLTKISRSGMHPSFDPDFIKTIPESAGVYYFFNEVDDLIYIGKSINLRKRIISHFGNEKNSRAIQMKSEIVRIDIEETGNELIALLKESSEIKKHKPRYNRAQRRSIFTTGLFSYQDQQGYLRFYIDKTKSNTQAIITFTSKEEARVVLEEKVRQHNLCQKLSGLYQNDGACFHYGIGECLGACIQIENPADYNQRAQEIVNLYRFKHPDCLIIDDGRSSEEHSVVLIRNGQYIGYGFFNSDFTGQDYSIIEDAVQNFDDNREVRHIIQSYIAKPGSYQILTKINESFQLKI